MLDKNIYDLTQQLQGALIQKAFAVQENPTSPDIPILMQLRRGYAESPGWLLVQAFEFDPQPLTVERFRRRAVYSAPGLTHALLELMASEKWLNCRPDGYYLTEVARQIWEAQGKRRKAFFTNFMPLPETEIHLLESLMKRIIDASLSHSEIPSIWSLAHSRRRAHYTDGSPVERIFQYCADFNALRDDTHMSAYAVYNVEGMVWETFSMISAGQAQTADALFDQLAYRGFTRAEWKGAIDRLTMLGWIEADVSCELTKRGEAIRNTVEQQTDRYFFAAWSVLDETEIDQLIDLMRRVIES